MGLDNGIIIKKINKEQINKIPDYINVEIYNDNKVEIAYWRKCWGIRNEILDILHMNDYTYTKNIDIEDIPALIKMLYNFLSENYWEENSDSIWEYEGMKEQLVQQIINLKWLYSFMKENNDIEVEFYDSY